MGLAARHVSRIHQSDGTFRIRAGIWISPRRIGWKVSSLCGSSCAWQNCSPTGGGTLFLAGSHRLVQDLADKIAAEKLRSAEAREGLIRNHPWVKGLCSFDANVDRVREFVKDGATIGDVNIRVVEMTGEPGDVFMTHPLILHAGSTNCAQGPRLVLSSTVYRAGVSVPALYE